MSQAPLRSEPIAFDRKISLIYQIWNRNFLSFKRSWKISLLWIVIEPLFVLGAIGYGLGSFVNNISGTSYVDFFYPALICTTSMFIAYFVSTYDNYSKLTFQRLYSTQITSAIEPQEIVLGEVLWAATKGTLSAVGVSLIAMILGLVDSWRIFPALLVVAVSCACFASFGMLVTTFIRNYDQIIYPSSGLMIPMSLFSGTYFPIANLPYGLKYLVYVFPLTHSVRMVRGILNADMDLWMLLNLAYLVILTLVLVKWSTSRLGRRILN